ncbi:DsbA family protein [Deinococcus altitudinis]|uniref:DsbA family protein n=1 Tax=Deinococcus altitudinis TaxID=468914 RepID=UPI0038914FD9
MHFRLLTTAVFGLASFVGALTSVARAEVGGTLSASLKAPELAGFKLAGTVLTAPDGTTVTLTTRGTLPGTQYLESAAVLLPTADPVQGGRLLNALTGEDLSAPLTAFLKRPEVQAKLAAGLNVDADPFTLNLKTVAGGLSLTVALQTLSGFGAVPVSRVLGDPAAPYAIRLYSDFQCPYCQQAELEALPTVLKNLPKDVRFEFHQFPLESLHPNARAAAEASVCAENQGKFFAFKDALFRRNDWQKSASPAGVFQAVAQGTGLNVATYRSCVAARGGKAEVDAGLAEASRLGLNSTPSVYIGNYRVADPYDPASYQALLDFVRAK